MINDWCKECHNPSSPFFQDDQLLLEEKSKTAELLQEDFESQEQGRDPHTPFQPDDEKLLAQICSLRSQRCLRTAILTTFHNLETGYPRCYGDPMISTRWPL
jgi:hypothetical protein